MNINDVLDGLRDIYDRDDGRTAAIDRLLRECGYIRDHEAGGPVWVGPYLKRGDNVEERLKEIEDEVLPTIKDKRGLTLKQMFAEEEFELDARGRIEWWVQSASSTQLS